MLITTIEWEVGLDADFNQIELKSMIYKKLVTTHWSFRDLIRHIEDRHTKFVLRIETEWSEIKSVERAIRKCIGNMLTVEGRNCPIRLYIGSYYAEHQSFNELDIIRSKYALQMAKRYGVKRNFIIDKQAEAYRREIIIEAMLPEGIAQNQFHLDLQPIYRLDHGELVGFEALVRWHHPQLGILSPIEFIPLAEQSGLINDLGEWVIDEACRLLTHIHQQQLGHFHISINVSPVQLMLGDVAELAIKYARKHGLQPQQIQFELTESTMELVDEQVIAAVKALKEAGFLLAIDDFGTGYAGLESLSTMPISCVKLDKHFICKLHSDQISATIVKHTIKMLDEMNLIIIAEGVETIEQYTLLANLGCTYAQGYYMSKPIPAADIDYERLEQLMSLNIHSLQ